MKIKNLQHLDLKLLIVTLFLLAFVVQFVQPLKAQTQLTTPSQNQNNDSSEQTLGDPEADLSLALDPPVAYIHVKPSEKLKHTVMVTNTGKKTLNITVNVTDFKPDGKTGIPVLQPGQVFNRKANPDLNFGEPFTLSPGENHSVTLEFDVAQLAAEKEYHLAILFNAKSQKADNEEENSETKTSAAQVSGTIVSNLIVFISPNEGNLGKLEIKEFNLPKIIDSFGGINFTLLAANTGANATPINGQAVIKNAFNQKINEYIFYPDYILAHSTRLARGIEPKPEIFDESGKIDIAKVDNISTRFVYKPPFMFGFYSVKVVLGQVEQTQTVIALPFSLIVLAAIGGLIVAGYKKIKKELN